MTVYQKLDLLSQAAKTDPVLREKFLATRNAPDPISADLPKKRDTRSLWASYLPLVRNTATTSARAPTAATPPPTPLLRMNTKSFFLLCEKRISCHKEN